MAPSRISRTVIPTVLALICCACGGGGGGADNGNQDLTVVLPMDTAFSGTMAVNSYTDTSTGIIAVGDYVVAGTDFDVRGFLSFSLSGIPAGAAIVSAQVVLSGRVRNGNPYATHGIPVVSPVDMGPSVSDDDFDAVFGPFIGNFPTWQPGAFQPGTISGDGITGHVRSDYAGGRARTSMRLRFSASPVNDGVDTLVDIEASNVDPSLRPVLVVTYR